MDALGVAIARPRRCGIHRHHRDRNHSRALRHHLLQVEAAGLAALDFNKPEGELMENKTDALLEQLLAEQKRTTAATRSVAVLLVSIVTWVFVGTFVVNLGMIAKEPAPQTIFLILGSIMILVGVVVAIVKANAELSASAKPAVIYPKTSKAPANADVAVRSERIAEMSLTYNERKAWVAAGQPDLTAWVEAERPEFTAWLQGKNN